MLYMLFFQNFTEGFPIQQLIVNKLDILGQEKS